MHLEKLITKVRRLPPSRQQEVLDFVTCLEHRDADTDIALTEPTDWSEQHFQAMSIEQAMRGLEDEPDIYSEADLKERWR